MLAAESIYTPDQNPEQLAAAETPKAEELPEGKE